MYFGRQGSAAGYDFGTDGGHMTALELRQLEFRVARLPATVRTGDRAGAERRTTAHFGQILQPLGAVWEADNNHAVIEQRRVKGADRGFVAAAGAGRDEYTGDLADQTAVNPEAAGLVEKITHLRRHVAEPVGVPKMMAS